MSKFTNPEFEKNVVRDTEGRFAGKGGRARPVAAKADMPYADADRGDGDMERVAHYCDMPGIRAVEKDGKTMLWVERPSRFSQEELAEIKRLKPLIVKELREREARARARYERAENIDGVREIRRMREQMDDYRRRFDAWCAGDGVTPPCPRKPFEDGELERMEAGHPLACAWLRADALADSPNYELAGIGDRAKERIMDGCDADKAERFMREEQDRFIKRHMWD